MKKSILLSILGSVVLLLGVSYAWFNYQRVSNKYVNLISGDIYLRLDDETNAINLTTVFPESSEKARSRNDNTIEFTVYSKNE